MILCGRVGVFVGVWESRSVCVWVYRRVGVFLCGESRSDFVWESRSVCGCVGE